MRRLGLALLCIAASPGCAHMSAGLWADSDRGERSVAAIASIDLPPEPVSARSSKPAVKTPPSPATSDEEWEVPHQKKPAPGSGPNPAPAAGSKIPSAQRPVTEVAEAWGPTVKVSKTAEYGAEPNTYRWLQGRVSFVKISGSRVWKIRFAPYDQADRYGGSFVLAGSLPADLKDGDLVRVEGGPATDQADTRNTRYNCTRGTILQRAERPAP